MTNTFSDYIIFVDESGDHSLVSIDKDYPIFVLAFIIVRKDDYAEKVVPSLKHLKFQFWGHDGVILHAHEIRKPKGDFGFLVVKEHRDAFMGRLNDIMNAAPFTLIATVIRKDKLTSRYVRPDNPYHLALGMCMERATALLMGKGQADRMTHVIAEGRGRREDEELELEFRRVLAGQTVLPYGVATAGATDRRLAEMDIRILSKQCNSEGLQLADLVAQPIGRSILKPAQDNRAMDILRPKLLRHSLEGLKTFPSH